MFNKKKKSDSENPKSVIIDPADIPPPDAYLPKIIKPKVVEAEVIESELEISKPQNAESMVGQQIKQSYLLPYRFWRNFGGSAYPLTAAKMEYLVRRLDAAGPMQLGFFYDSLLRQECEFLLPRPVFAVDDWYWAEVVKKWNSSQGFFQCRNGIGMVLNIYTAIVKATYEDFNKIH